MSVYRNPWAGVVDTSPANKQHAGRMPRWHEGDATHASFATEAVRGHQDLYVPLATTTTAGAMSAADYTNFHTFPSCRVYNSAQLIIATGTVTVMTYDTERTDTAAFHSTSSNTGRLTVPTGYGGLYLVGGAWQWDAQAGGGRRVFTIRHQGTTTIASNEAVPNGTTTFPTMTAVALYRAAAGEYFDSVAFHDRGSNLGVVAGVAYSPEFWLVRLGD